MKVQPAISCNSGFYALGAHLTSNSTSALLHAVQPNFTSVKSPHVFMNYLRLMSWGMKMQIFEAIFSRGQKEPWQSLFWKWVQYYKLKTSYHQSGGKQTNKTKTTNKLELK